MRAASKLAVALGPRALAWLAAGAVASLALSGLEVTVAVLIQHFLRALGLGVPSGPLPGGELGMGAVAVGLAVVAAGRSVAQLVVARSGNVAMESMTARLRRLAVWELLLAPGQRPIAASRMSALVGETFVKSSYFAAAAAVALGAGVQALGLAVAMLAGAPREAAVGLASLVVVGALVHALGKRSRAVAEKVPAEHAELTRGIERVARSFLLVRALRTQAVEHGRLTRAIDAYERHSVRATFLGDLASALTPFAGVVLIVCVAAFSDRVLHTPGLVLLSFFYLFVRFVQALSLTVSQLSFCFVSAPQLEQTLDFVGRLDGDTITRALSPTDAPGPRREVPAEGAVDGPPAIHAEALRFRYDGAASDALAGVSLEVPAGGALSVVGPSGAGKSTLLALLLGLEDPASGTLTVGGRPPRDYFADPRVRVGFVGPEPFLVAGTVRDNLRYGSAREQGDDALWAALEAARLREVIERAAGGLDHPIGEDGSGLSAGERQRLGLARALLAEPHVLVLDEPTANLDEETELAVGESLEALAGRTTLLLVTHRRALARIAGSVVALEAGARASGEARPGEGPA